MKPLARNLIAKPFGLLLALILALLMPYGSAYAQDRSPFSQQQLEQTLAPIALYPDPLLSQILMASTYPLEVVEAARWSRSHTNLIGEEAVRAAKNENWDPSVKSLLSFPQVLTRMDENLQWLQMLGDAFLGQEPQVMDAVQNLRRRAQIEGNLRSDERQHIVETGPLLVVQPANPLIIYVPYYDPRVVYGPWWWPDYSPVYWRPFPGYYVRPGVASSFYWGPSIRVSVGYFFGGFDWSHRHVRVVQSNYYYSVVTNQRATAIARDRPPGTWQHDPVHRRGVAYRGAEVQKQFASPRTRPDSGHQLSREDARRQDQQRAQSYPTSIQRSDPSRPAVQTGVQSTSSSKVQPAIQQVAQPYSASRRSSEPRNEIRRTAAQPVRDTPVQPVIQQVAVKQPDSGPDVRTERRERVKNVDRGDRKEPPENRQATRPANVVPQTQRSRGEPTSSQGDQTERSARPNASESKQESRSSSANRQKVQRGDERRKEI